MDSQNLTRLQEEQAKAVSETDQQILQIEKFQNDYKTLQERLRTLPQELTHDVMVPFGKLAFMPGKLVHTNEILVLLGDNWFVERSAKQAEDIAQRRIEELNKQLNNLKAQRKLLEPRLDFTSDFQSHIEGQKDVKEIVEKYDAEKERLWDEQHRKNVRKQREAAKQLQENSQAHPEKANKGQDVDTDLWARLDALEEEERERRELESGDSEEEAVEMKGSPVGKKISWQDETTAKRRQESHTEDSSDADAETSDSDDTSDDFEDDDAEGNERRRPAVKTIKFSHSDTPSHQASEGASVGDTTIESPADIYKLFSPAPILKKPVTSEREGLNSSKGMGRTDADFTSGRAVDGHRATAESVCATGPPPPAVTSCAKAFTGRVLETSQNRSGTTGSHDSTSNLEVRQGKASNTATKDEAPKRVSKFKASRMAQQRFS